MRFYIVLAIGGLFAVLGIFQLIKQLRSMIKNTGTVTGSVSGYHVEMHADTETHMEQEIYFPIFFYTVDGRDYEVRSDSGTNHHKYAVGESVVLKYNPDKPEDVIVEGDKTTLVISIVIALMGIGVCLLAIFRM